MFACVCARRRGSLGVPACFFFFFHKKNVHFFEKDIFSIFVSFFHRFSFFFRF